MASTVLNAISAQIITASITTLASHGESIVIGQTDLLTIVVLLVILHRIIK